MNLSHKKFFKYLLYPQGQSILFKVVCSVVVKLWVWVKSLFCGRRMWYSKFGKRKEFLDFWVRILWSNPLRYNGDYSLNISGIVKNVDFMNMPQQYLGLRPSFLQQKSQRLSLYLFQTNKWSFVLTLELKDVIVFYLLTVKTKSLYSGKKVRGNRSFQKSFISLSQVGAAR